MKKLCSKLTMAVLCAMLLGLALAGPASAAEAPKGIITGIHEEMVTIPEAGTAACNAELRGGLRILAEAKGMVISIENSTVAGEMTVEAAEIELNVDARSKVESLTLDASAEGVRLTVDGSVAGLVVKAKDVSVSGTGSVEVLTAGEDVTVAASLKVEKTDRTGTVNPAAASGGAASATDNGAAKETTMVIIPIGGYQNLLPPTSANAVTAETLDQDESLKVTVDTSALKAAADAVAGGAQAPGQDPLPKFDYDSVEVYLCVSPNGVKYLVFTGAEKVPDSGVPEAVEAVVARASFNDGSGDGTKTWYKASSTFTVECTGDQKATASMTVITAADTVAESGESAQTIAVGSSSMNIDLNQTQEEAQAPAADEETKDDSTCTGDEAANPGTGNETTNPGTGDETTNPGTGNETTNPGTGNETTNPGTGNETTNPGTGNETTNPGTGNEATNPGTGDETTNPGTGDETTNPGTGDEATNPGTGNETTNPGTGNETTNPGTGNETTNPGTGNEATNPGTGDETTNPGTGDETTNPGTGNETTNPGTGNEATNPGTNDGTNTDTSGGTDGSDKG